MTLVRDLFEGARLTSATEKPEVDPFSDRDALQEAQLVEVVFEPRDGRLGLLFDLRQALKVRLADTALIVFEGVEDVSWIAQPRATSRTVWTVVGSEPNLERGLVGIDLFFVPDASLRVLGHAARFVAGLTAGLPAAPPNLRTATAEEIASGMPSFASSLEATYATSVERLR